MSLMAPADPFSIETRADPGVMAAPADLPALRAGQVHVWLISIEERDAGELGEVLSDAERLRARQLVFGRDRAQFVTCRAALRRLLGQYLNCAANAVRFQYGAFGKPALAAKHPRPGLQFNLSHTRGMGVIALALDRPVGVDVERVHSLPRMREIAQRYFNDRERCALARVPEREWTRAFFQLWTAREAALKVSGAGLAGWEQARAWDESGGGLTIRRWEIPSHQCVASLAAPGANWTWHCRRWRG